MKLKLKNLKWRTLKLKFYVGSFILKLLLQETRVESVIGLVAYQCFAIVFIFLFYFFIAGSESKRDWAWVFHTGSRWIKNYCQSIIFLKINGTLVFSDPEHIFMNLYKQKRVGLHFSESHIINKWIMREIWNRISRYLLLFLIRVGKVRFHWPYTLTLEKRNLSLNQS